MPAIISFLSQGQLQFRVNSIQSVKLCAQLTDLPCQVKPFILHLHTRMCVYVCVCAFVIYCAYTRTPKHIHTDTLSAYLGDG